MKEISFFKKRKLKKKFDFVNNILPMTQKYKMYKRF